MDVATDTCILINLAVVGRLDLLKLVPPYIFHAASEVLGEIEDLDQKTAVDQAIAAGYLDEVKLDQPGELGLYVSFNATLGKGESACLALGKARGWAIATVEKGDFRCWLRDHQHAGNSFGGDSGWRAHRDRRRRDQIQTRTKTLQNEV
jgi:predicted nucleic acid-binding protein